MTDMLTAKEMQELLQVDRSTIYRMAEAGQLPALKVGKQWRFPADQVESQFQLKLKEPSPGYEASPALAGNGAQELRQLLPMECVQLIQDTFADLLGAMLVITDMEGNPITQLSNACGLFEAVSEEPYALQRCIETWHDLATTIDLEPRFSRGYLGLMCTRALIRVGSELKGMVVAGCVASEDWPPSPADVQAMAQTFGVAPERLQDRLEGVFHLDRAERRTVLSQIQRIANIVAHIVTERKALFGRLEAIADLTVI